LIDFSSPSMYPSIKTQFHLLMENLVSVASEEAEQLLLGRMICSPEDRKQGCDLLREDYFYFSENRRIYQVLQKLEQNQKPAELPLLIEELKATKQLESVKGVDYLMQLAQSAPSPIHLESYAQIVKNNWAKRQIIEELKKAGAEIGNIQDVPNFLDLFTQKFQKISKHLSPSEAHSFFEISKGSERGEYLKALEKRKDFFREHNKPYVDGIPTGYSDLDQVIGGFGNSNLMILASRPGMGKTALALNFATRISKDHSIGIISLEMSSEQLYERVLSIESEISGSTIREGRVSDEEWNKIIEVEPQISRLPIYVQEGGCFIQELVAKTRFLKEEKGIQLLIIDYLQLVKSKGETRIIEISNITRDLKNLAVELHLPILCLSQLSRKVEERTNHRPLLSDLRESGTIEQDADVVTFLLRPDYYNENDRPNEAELIVAKNRHGKTGTVSLYFSKSFAKFNSLDSGENEENDFF